MFKSRAGLEYNVWRKVEHLSEKIEKKLDKVNLLYSHDWFFLWFAEVRMDNLSLQLHLAQMHVISFYSRVLTHSHSTTHPSCNCYKPNPKGWIQTLKQKLLPMYLTFLVQLGVVFRLLQIDLIRMYANPTLFIWNCNSISSCPRLESSRLKWQ